ncbi:hypothetical protein CS0771_31680 [Catellatospora sp. IY07-71]|nr:hypothetical protein CS0771_31680 [Catellatospora sp. IY07-71]
MADLNRAVTGNGERIVAELLERFELTAAAGKPASTYSGGMRRKLDLAMTLVGNPQIIFLDEPTTGLDPRSRRTMWSIVQDLVADGVTVFLAIQYLEEADQLADRIAVLDQGRLVAQGTPDELKRQIPGTHVRLRFTTGRRTRRRRAGLPRSRSRRRGAGPARRRRHQDAAGAVGPALRALRCSRVLSSEHSCCRRPLSADGPRLIHLGGAEWSFRSHLPPRGWSHGRLHDRFASPGHSGRLNPVRQGVAASVNRSQPRRHRTRPSTNRPAWAHAKSVAEYKNGH